MYNNQLRNNTNKVRSSKKLADTMSSLDLKGEEIENLKKELRLANEEFENKCNIIVNELKKKDSLQGEIDYYKNVLIGIQPLIETRRILWIDNVNYISNLWE